MGASVMIRRPDWWLRKRWWRKWWPALATEGEQKKLAEKREACGGCLYYW